MTGAPVPPDSAGPQLYLKHVVSSPEDLRHGYLVVAILFSEHTSLWGKKSWRGNSVEGQRQSGEQDALGSASRRTGCYWSPGGLSSRNEPGELPRTGRPQSQVTRKAKEVGTGARRESRPEGTQRPTHSWERRGGSRKRWKSPGSAKHPAGGSESRDLWVRHLGQSAPRQPALSAPSASSAGAGGPYLSRSSGSSR